MRKFKWKKPYSPSKTCIFSDPRFGFPADFFKNQSLPTLPSFLEISFLPPEKGAEDYGSGITKDVKQTHTHTHTYTHRGNMRTQPNSIWQFTGEFHLFFVFTGVKETMIYIGECKNAILINRGMILETIFHRGTHQGRFDWSIENKGVLSCWLSQMLNTKKC